MEIDIHIRNLIEIAMYKEKGVFAFCHTYPVRHMLLPFLEDRFSVLDTLGGVDSVIEGTKAEDR